MQSHLGSPTAPDLALGDLEWWKSRSFRFQTLLQMAIHVLAKKKLAKATKILKACFIKELTLTIMLHKWEIILGVFHVVKPARGFCNHSLRVCCVSVNNMLKTYIWSINFILHKGLPLNPGMKCFDLENKNRPGVRIIGLGGGGGGHNFCPMIRD